MQSGIQSSLSWTQIAFGIVASFMGGGGAFKLFNSWLNRNKPAAEIHETEARAFKTTAEGTKLNADTLERWLTRVDQMRAKVDSLSEERDSLRLQNELQRIELTMHEHDIKKMKGILDARGIKLSDYDEPKEMR